MFLDLRRYHRESRSSSATRHPVGLLFVAVRSRQTAAIFSQLRLSGGNTRRPLLYRYFARRAPGRNHSSTQRRGGPRDGEASFRAAEAQGERAGLRPGGGRGGRGGARLGRAGDLQVPGMYMCMYVCMSITYGSMTHVLHPLSWVLR